MLSNRLAPQAQRGLFSRPLGSLWFAHVVRLPDICAHRARMKRSRILNRCCFNSVHTQSHFAPNAGKKRANNGPACESRNSSRRSGWTTGFRAAARTRLESYSISGAHGARMFQASEQRERFSGNEPAGSFGSRDLTPCQ